MPRRRGFTLVELLVVIAVIAVLLGILLVGVQHARQSATRSQCQNNMRQLGQSLHNYESAYKAFPPCFKTNYYSVYAYMLPFMGQSQTFNMAKAASDASNTLVSGMAIQRLYCPLAGTEGRGAVSDYTCARCIDGTAATVLQISGSPTNPDSMGLLIGDKTTRIRDVRDGLGNTIMLVEDGGRPLLYQLGKLVAGASPNPLWAEWDLKISLGLPCANNTRLINCTNNNEIYGLHPGGANFLMGDASCVFLREDLDIRTVKALITRSGEETLPEVWRQ